jgi:chemotaxis protein MotB
MIFMAKGITALFCLFPLLGLVGCVGQSAYEKKSVEATSFSRNLAEEKQINAEIVRENEDLRADISGLRAKVDELETARKRLEQTIGSGEQNPYQFVAELEREKYRLREDLAKIMRTQDDRVRTCSSIYESFLERMKEDIAQGQLRVSELRGTIRLEFRDEEIFDGTRMTLTPQGTSLIRKVSDLLKDTNDIAVSVETYYEIPSTSDKQLTPWQAPVQRTVSIARLLLQSGVKSTILGTNTRGMFGTATKNEMMTGSGNAAGIEISIAVKE